MAERTGEKGELLARKIQRLRILVWSVGTIGAGMVPIVANPAAALFSADLSPSWHEVCRGGDFFLVGMIVIIASICELLPTFFGNLTLNQRISVVARLVGAGMFAFALFFAYLLALVGKNAVVPSRHVAFENFFTEAVSPLAWVLSSVFAVWSVGVAGGHRDD